MKEPTFDEKCQSFSKKIGYQFEDESLLQMALTHSSFARRSKSVEAEDNERLEFLGDAVLKIIVSEYLYNRFGDKDEGTLTNIRANVISDKNLAKIGEYLDIGSHMRFSYGEENTGGNRRPSNLANAVEALLGAIYLDSGLGAAKTFLTPLVEYHHRHIISGKQQKDHKTLLQEYLQSKKQQLPKYDTIKEEGPDHQKIFHVEVSVELEDAEIKETGKGQTKKDAEQSAAKALYDTLK